MSTIAENMDSIVETTHGSVRGKVRKTMYNDLYCCFEGIPYAQPPLGELRFKAPIQAKPWSDVLDCTKLANKCLQYNRYADKVEGSEDCLYLNIYAKNLHTDKVLPVMVYVHGGGYSTGDATRLSWGPEYFMMKDVVFITIGYRLGLLGFMSLAEPSLQVPGNAGLKDVIMALQWIKRNCCNFNGDPNNITLFGHSAGGCATHTLMQSPKCEGLFHKAILMAGFCIDLKRLPNLEYRFAQQIGYEGDNIDSKIYDYMSKIEAEKLVRYNFWTKEESDRGYGYPFGPCIEPYDTNNSVIREAPIQASKSTWGNKIPIMLGTTSKEGLIQYKYYTKPDLYAQLQIHPEYLMPHQLQYGCDLEMQKKLAEKAIKLHFGDKELSLENHMDTIEHRIVLSRLAHGAANTFLYRFDFDSPTFNLYRIKHCGPEMRGVGHVDELSYIFYMPTSFKLQEDSAEYLTIKRMIDIWTAFAAKSDPNAKSLEGITWQPVQCADAYKCLNISYELTFIDSPELSKCKIWDSFYQEADVKMY